MWKHIPRGEHHPGEKFQPGEGGWGAVAVQTNKQSQMVKQKHFHTQHPPPPQHTQRIPTSQEIKRLNYFLNLSNDLPITFKNAYGLIQVPPVIWIPIGVVQMHWELQLKPERYSARRERHVALGDMKHRRSHLNQCLKTTEIYCRGHKWIKR